MAIQTRVNRSLASLFDEYGEKLVENLKRALVDVGKYSTGGLVDSISYNVKVADGKVLVELDAQDYLRFVDKGRRPGTFPNISAIERWANARGISQRYVFPIALKIKEEGIPATNVVKKSLDKTNKEFMPIYREQLSKMIGLVLVNDVFNQTTTQGRIISKKFK